jgi:hypothetical protein
MAKDISGTIRKVTLDGVTYNVAADANITEVGSAYQNESVPTSGQNMRKMTKRSENREGIDLIVNGDERDNLKMLAERVDDFPMSYETAAGDIYRATGWIEFESRETQDNKATVQLLPRDNWESFIAS